MNQVAFVFAAIHQASDDGGCVQGIEAEGRWSGKSQMNTKLRDVFRGKVVNKAHTINAGVDEFPRYVLEYLIDNYPSGETFK